MALTIQRLARRCGLLLCSLAIWPSGAVADAIVRTQAMFATTIAEIFVEPDRVRVELEIGLADIEAFENLLPDEIFARLRGKTVPLPQRLEQFFSEDLTFETDGERRLQGRLLEIGPRERLRRDEVSGEVLAATDAEPETVVFARLEYALDDQPERLTVYGPSGTRQASVGFVLYHAAIAVNDFRYLAPAQTVNLDWDDPFYSAFDNRALRRTYFAPMSGFIYVEPYEVRKEIILRPKDLQRWVDLGLEDRDVISVDMQAELKRQVAEFLRERQVVTIDGEQPEPELARINFLERTLRTSRVIDPPEDLDADAATLGVIFVYPTVEPLPQRVDMEWDLFDERIQLVPGSTVDQAGPLPTFIEPDFSTLTWQNFLKNPELPTLVDLRRPPTVFERALIWLRWVLLVLCGITAGWAVQRLRSGERATAAAAVLPIVAIATGLSFWFGAMVQLNDQRSEELVSGLLHNVYRAFDFRHEEDIYDVLEQSVAGDLLSQVYLETRQGLVLANQGGARAKVKNIELEALETRSGDNGGIIADATWQVGGSVGHWGHVHQRVNRYRGELNIEPVDGIWKLVAVEILEEERI